MWREDRVCEQEFFAPLLGRFKGPSLPLFFVCLLLFFSFSSVCRVDVCVRDPLSSHVSTFSLVLLESCCMETSSCVLRRLAPPPLSQCSCAALELYHVTSCASGSVTVGSTEGWNAKLSGSASITTSRGLLPPLITVSWVHARLPVSPLNFELLRAGTLLFPD